MGPSTYILAAFVLVLVGLAISYPIIKEILHIQRTPTTWINALPPAGPVEIAGHIGPATSESPLTFTKCGLWKVEVEEQRSSGKRSSWSTVYKGQSDQVFQVIDETGQIQVDPAGADIILKEDTHQSGYFFDSGDSKFMASMAGLGVEMTTGLGFKKTLKASECYLQPGEDVYILGDIQCSDGGKILVASRGCPLIIGDRSEKEVLQALYFRAALRVGMTLVIGAGAVYLLSKLH